MTGQEQPRDLMKALRESLEAATGREPTCGHPTDEGDTTGPCARHWGHPLWVEDGVGCSLDPDPEPVTASGHAPTPAAKDDAVAPDRELPNDR